jgi:hypothetical protein
MLFIALRRPGVVTYPVLVASNARRDSRYYNAEALRMVRTLRGRPPGAGASGASPGAAGAQSRSGRSG